MDRRSFLRRAGKVGLGVGLASQVGWLTASNAGGSGSSALRELARRVRGRDVPPGDRGYANAGVLSDPRFDGVRPDAVVFGADVEDVEPTIRWAEQHDVPCVAQWAPQLCRVLDDYGCRARCHPTGRRGGRPGKRNRSGGAGAGLVEAPPSPALRRPRACARWGRDRRTAAPVVPRAGKASVRPGRSARRPTPGAWWPACRGAGRRCRRSGHGWRRSPRASH